MPTTAVPTRRSDDLADPSKTIVETKCHDWTDVEVQRIKVFHHGHEEAGTSHKCKLIGAKAPPSDTSYATDIARACECVCKTTNSTAQDTQQQSKVADDEMYRIRADAQAARDHGAGDFGEHPYSGPGQQLDASTQQHDGTPY